MMDNKIKKADQLDIFLDQLNLLTEADCKFPKYCFKPKKWKVIPLETHSIFDEAAYKNFIYYTKELYTESLFISPENMTDYKFSFPLEFPTSLNFEEFDNFVQYDLNYKSAVNSFIFSELDNWCLYVNTDIEIMLLGYDQMIEDIVLKHFGASEDRIRSFEELFSLIIDWVRPEEKEGFLSVINKGWGARLNFQE